jgi:nitroreductase
LGKIFSDVLSAEDPSADPASIEKAAACTLRAPLIVIVVACIEHRDDVPDIEQHLSAGAAAQLITVAAHALGFGAIWRTGAMAYRPAVSKSLGLKHNELIVGFIYIGTPKAVKPLAPGDYREFVEYMD